MRFGHAGRVSIPSHIRHIFLCERTSVSRGTYPKQPATSMLIPVTRCEHQVLCGAPSRFFPTPCEGRKGGCLRAAKIDVKRASLAQKTRICFAVDQKAMPDLAAVAPQKWFKMDTHWKQLSMKMSRTLCCQLHTWCSVKAPGQPFCACGCVAAMLDSPAQVPLTWLQKNQEICSYRTTYGIFRASSKADASQQYSIPMSTCKSALKEKAEQQPWTF